MRLSLLALLLLPASFAVAQTSDAPVAVPTASSLLAPALDQLRQSLGSVRVEKWKAPGAVKGEAGSNVQSMERDLEGTLPGLLQTADAAPGVVSKNLPVFRNTDALYDVLLRVVASADLFAPPSEVNTLHAAMFSLENARRTLGDTLQSSAATQEEQNSRLQAQLQARPPAPAAASVVDDGTKPAVPIRRKKAVAKPPQ